MSSFAFKKVKVVKCFPTHCSFTLQIVIWSHEHRFFSVGSTRRRLKSGSSPRTGPAPWRAWCRRSTGRERSGLCHLSNTVLMGGTSRRAWPQTSGKLPSSRGKVYYYLMRIRIRLITLMRLRNRILDSTRSLCFGSGSVTCCGPFGSFDELFAWLNVNWIRIRSTVLCSVGDPHAFWPPVSGFIMQRNGSGPDSGCESGASY